ncbi:MAG: PQQ-binding-like beta-propeller repeat protein [Actinomycetota bacterium]
MTGEAISPDGSLVFVAGFSGDSYLGSTWDVFTVAYASSDGKEAWRSSYDGPSGLGDAAYGVTVSRDGSRVYVVGARDMEGGPYAQSGHGDLVVVCYSATMGEQLWVASYDGPVAGGNDRALAVAVGAGPQGERVYVTGVSDGSTPSATSGDIITLAFQGETGVHLWTSRYDGSSHGRDEPTGMVASPDGTKVLVTGMSQGEPGAYDETKFDYITLAYDTGIDGDPDGRLLWTSRYDGSAGEHDVANAIAGSPDGSTIFVTGESAGQPNQPACAACDYATLAYDAATGKKLWLSRYQSPLSSNGLSGSEGRALQVSPDGKRLYVTGFSVGAASDYVTIAYDAASGSELWRSTYPSPLEDDAWSLAVSPDGNTVYVSGQSVVPAGYSIPVIWLWGEAVTVAYDASSGTQKWMAHQSSEPVPVSSYVVNDYAHPGNRMVVAPDGRSVYVSWSLAHPVDGLFEEKNASDFETVAYSS